jgi:uncharacterized membrane protein YheB (UPF0754 family)
MLHPQKPEGNKWGKAILSIGLTGVCFSGFFLESRGVIVGKLLWIVGGSGIVGLVTNVLAVRMIFHKISLRIGDWEWILPGSGVVTRNQERILETLARELRERLLTQETLEKAVSEGKLLNRVGPTFQKEMRRLFLRRSNLRRMGSAMEGPLQRLLLGPETGKFVKNQVEKALQDSLILGMAGRLGLLKSELISDWVIRSASMSLSKALLTEEGLRDTQRKLAALLGGASHLGEEEIIVMVRDSFERLLIRMLREIDLGELAKSSLRKATPEQLEDYLEALARKYLDWIEIWGGLMGAGLGFCIWIFS